jgi:hypothetical protein
MSKYVKVKVKGKRMGVDAPKQKNSYGSHQLEESLTKTNEKKGNQFSFRLILLNGCGFHIKKSNQRQYQ